METFLIYICVGAIAGIFAGLLGIGGGLIIVPALTLVFASIGVSSEINMHVAVGSSLASIIFTSISSVWAHHQRAAVLWKLVQVLVPGIILGALCGAILADYFTTTLLRKIFAVFVLLAAIQIAFQLMPSTRQQLPGIKMQAVAGFLIGSISAIVGIGGGSLTVPFLIWCKINIRHAIASSSACGLPIAIAGGLGFMLMGWNHNKLLEYSTGYIYWPAVLGIALASVVTAPLGAVLTHYLPVAILKRVFAMLLFILSARMFFWA